jgi:hypothetical protein
MPEQLTKHPEVTLQVLKSAGAQCGAVAKPEILTACPAERFCKLPGGEICVYGLADATRMTQITAADWQVLSPPSLAQHRGISATEVTAIVGALIVGAAVGVLVQRRRSGTPSGP